MRDLFGEVAVSLRELQLWLYLVPRLPHYSTRREVYAKGYNIAFKSARAKEEGDLAEILGDESCEFCGQTLCMEKEDISPPVRPVEELARLRRRVMVLELLITPGVSETRPALSRNF
jgi:hypothetical protein